MRNARKTQIAALIFGISLLALQQPLKAQKAKPPARAGASHTNPVPSHIWKSKTTGKEYRVQIDKERFYAEWANMPPELVKHKAYIRSEALPSGSKWIGTSRSFLQCAADDATQSKAGTTRWCHFDTRFEVDSIAPDRITGHGDTLRRFDCNTCKVLETGWAEFVWVPKR